MKPLYAIVVTLFVCLLTIHANAQDKNPLKLGKITAEDFNVKEVDTGTAAVVIADIGITSLEGNTKGWFTVVYKRITRVKILTKNGFDAADVKIPLYASGNDEERLADLKGTCYNLENGKIDETKLDAGSIFKEKLSKYYTVRKFTMPNVKVGSIIEYSYTVYSEAESLVFLFNLHSWEFQGEYPRLWSEYNVKIPQFFDYMFMRQGYHPYFVEDSKAGFGSFNIIFNDDPTQRSHSVTLSGGVAEMKWAMKDVPALKKESFTSTLDNHIAKISFQLAQYQFPDQPAKKIMGNWFTVAEQMMKSEDFGGGLDKANNWLDDDIKKICPASDPQLEKARKIYAFVRDNFTCTDHSARYMTSNAKQVFSKHNGNVADINLLLITMLRHEGITASPVILSTRDNGFTNATYPIMERFNYVICEAEIDGKKHYLDASREYLGFDKLPTDCYNGHARVINTQLPAAIYFEPDSLMEKKTTSIFIFNDQQQKDKMTASFQTTLGYFESVSTRESLKAKGKDEFFKKIKSAYSFDIDIANPEIDSTKGKEEVLSMRYNFTFDKPQDGMLYLNPMLSEATKENYFKATQRLYPVEMPFAMDETYILDMEIPEGYVVEELPKPARVNFNETDGSFEYLIDQNAGHVRLRSRIRINKATFMPEEYNSLREFFGYIVKKHAEQVVMKKK